MFSFQVNVISTYVFLQSRLPLLFNYHNEVCLGFDVYPVFNYRLFAGEVPHRPYTGRNKGSARSSAKIIKEFKARPDI